MNVSTSKKIILVDTHCHLDMEAYQSDLPEVLDRAAKSHVHHVLTIGIDVASSRRAVQLAEEYTCISASVGIHPHDVGSITLQDYKDIGDLIEKHRNKIVAYGEIGLDYVKRYSPIDQQKKHFSYQLHLAAEYDLPAIIHDREAHEDILRILKSAPKNKQGGVIHCFSGDLYFARQCIDLGYFISVPGVVTFKNAASLHEVAREIDGEHLLLETDGPFLAPHPFRGKRNEPAYILQIAKHVAHLRSMDVTQLADITTSNAQRLFGLNQLQNNETI